MRALFRRTVAVVILLVLSASACKETSSNNRPEAQANANAPGALSTSSVNENSNSASSTAPAEAASNSWAVTLPVLSAFLEDQDFVAKTKSDLKLTDEQIQKLKEVSDQAEAELQRSEQTEGEHSPESDFRKKAESEIKRIIGDEKGARLLALVTERWNRSEPLPTGARTAPGAVPEDTRIVINIPACRMDLFDNGRLIKSYKVGIGYPEFPLPTGLRRADRIIFNPPWIPPESPWVEKMGRKIKGGETIKPGSRLNPLGLLKVPIGFAALIHGGKPPVKIGTYASHGCVGLTNSQAREFAPFLAQLGGVELTEDQIAEYTKDRSKSKTVKLPRPVPVELRYDTMVLEGGNIHIYPDVYYRGVNTEPNLRAALESFGVRYDQLNESERTDVLSALQEMNSEMPGGDRESTASADSTADRESRNGHPNLKNARYASRKNSRGKLPNEIVVQTPSLSGRGYPDPVDLNTGTTAGTKPRRK